MIVAHAKPPVRSSLAPFDPCAASAVATLVIITIAILCTLRSPLFLFSRNKERVTFVCNKIVQDDLIPLKVISNSLRSSVRECGQKVVVYYS